MIVRAPVVSTVDGQTVYSLPAEEPAGYVARVFDGASYVYYMPGDAPYRSDTASAGNEQSDLAQPAVA